MGYKAYVENVIMESGLEETDELLEILESCETVEDLEAVEEYLTEKKGEPKPSKGYSLSDVKKLDGANLRTRAGVAASAAKDALGKPGKAVGDAVARRELNKLKDKYGDYNLAEGDIDLSSVDKKGNMAEDYFNKGAIAVGATALLAMVAGASLKIRSAVKKANSTPAKQIEKQIKDLEDQAQDVAKRCKKGDITAKEAKVETKKIQVQIKKLAKEAAKIAAAEAKATKESVDTDITDLQLEIFEACESGSITEEDRDGLLELLED